VEVKTIILIFKENLCYDYLRSKVAHKKKNFDANLSLSNFGRFYRSFQRAKQRFGAETGKRSQQHRIQYFSLHHSMRFGYHLW
jgi:hypothetical protein